MNSVWLKTSELSNCKRQRLNKLYGVTLGEYFKGFKLLHRDNENFMQQLSFSYLLRSFIVCSLKIALALTFYFIVINLENNYCHWWKGE